MRNGGPAPLLLDTHYCIWLQAGSGHRISLKLRACEEWVRQALVSPGLTLAPLTPEIAIESSRLPGVFHGDPADRIIVATARRMRARVLTADERTLEYGRQNHVVTF